MSPISTQKDYREIQLPSGHVALVDEEDYERTTAYRWYYWRVSERRGCWVVTNSMMRLHHLVLNTPKNLHVQHLNENRLDNRKANLSQVGHDKISVACDGCSITFQRYPSSIRGGRNFHSRKCREQNSGGKVAFTCDTCGKPNVHFRARFNKYELHFCNAACQHANPYLRYTKAIKLANRVLPIIYTPEFLRRCLKWDEEGCAFRGCVNPKSRNRWHLCPHHNQRRAEAMSHQKRRYEFTKHLRGGNYVST